MFIFISKSCLAKFMTGKIIRNYLPELYALVISRKKPAMVTVNLTNRCNQRCIYCELSVNKSDLGDKALSLADLKWIIDEMAVNKIRRISLCGGEPFLFEGIIEVIAYAGSKGIRCSVTTNGMTAHKLSDNALNVLVRYKTQVNISIDSLDETIQSFTRGTSSALKNALLAIELLGNKSIPVTVLTAISRYNYHSLSGFLYQAYEKGIMNILFQPIIYYSNYPDLPVIERKSELNVPVDKLDILMRELKQIHLFERTHQISTNVYRILPWLEFYLKRAAQTEEGWFFTKVVNKFFCREIYAIIDIAYDGGIQPCGLALATVDIHANRSEGLISLWSKATEELKRDMLLGRYHDFCNGCCHHFSRNMLASVIKYPLQNRKAAIQLGALLAMRFLSVIYKRFLKKHSKPVRGK